jgi:hypothetical protein
MGESLHFGDAEEETAMAESIDSDRFLSDHSNTKQRVVNILGKIGNSMLM